MEYSLIRSGRKSLSLTVTPQATVQVRAPRTLPRSEIERFIKAKSDWICRQITRQNAIRAQREQFCLDYGSAVLYRGKSYTLTATSDCAAGPWEGRFYVPESLDSAGLMRCLTALYRRLAKELLTERLAFYAPKLGVKPGKMHITGAKKRWGSCGAKGTLNFTWRLIMAGDGAIDSVVIHELAHLKEFNHSPKFWALVADICPDYAKQRQSLRVLQERLAKEYWV